MKTFKVCRRFISKKTIKSQVSPGVPAYWNPLSNSLMPIAIPQNIEDFAFRHLLPSIVNRFQVECHVGK